MLGNFSIVYGLYAKISIAFAKFSAPNKPSAAIECILNVVMIFMQG